VVNYPLLPPLLRPGQTCGELVPSTESGLLIDARDYYRALFHSLRRARKYIALTGWQFDSNVSLLRGDDAQEAEGMETQLLPFLNQLCERNPDLRVYLLAWDFSVIYAIEREWLQKLVFSWKSHPHVEFQFDTAHAMGASHHQKLVVVDGLLAFAGGMDLAASRWDRSAHAVDEPGRRERATPHGPYHDVQAMVRGEAAQRLTALFQERWSSATGKPLELPPPQPILAPIPVSISLPAGKVAISQTRGCTLSPKRESVEEIRKLYVESIASARELIYIENQYFTSRVIHDALIERMRASGPKLEIAIVLPVRAEALKEQATLGVIQARLLRSLQMEAARTGHAFGLYCSVQRGGDGEPLGTYIHSKLMVIDDRLLTVGSANTTNRSMALDTELNLSWESRAPFRFAELRRAIARVRRTLLAEHAGVGPELLRPVRGLVRTLDALIDSGQGRLQRHVPESIFDKSPVLKPLEPESTVFDPEQPIEAEVFEAMASGEEGAFTRGIQFLSDLLSKRPTATGS
jgi:phospholipase D1/2